MIFTRRLFRLLRVQKMSYKYRLFINHHKRTIFLALLMAMLGWVAFRYFTDVRSGSSRYSEDDTDLDSQEAELEGDMNISWEDKRKALLSASGPTKLFLFAYMRGGSSTAGEIFNQDDSASMWYEPDAAFFTAVFGLGEENFPQHDLYFSNLTRRMAHDLERSWMTDYYSNMLNCQYESLPPESLGHWFVTKSAFLTNYTACMGSDIQSDYTLNKCVRMITPLCGTTVETSLQQKCHLLIEATRRVFIEHPDIFREMLHSLTDLMEFNAYTYQMTNLLSSKLSGLGYFSPMVMARLKWFVQHRLCMETVRINNDKCMNLATSNCEESNVRAVQVNRMNMENLEGLIEENPDIYVMYFVRDPRAITLSRVNTDHLVWDVTDKSPMKEARIICHKMTDDILQMRRLEEKYPGVFFQTSYEQLIQDPAGMAAQVYAKFGKEPSAKWEQYAQMSMHALENGGPYDNILKDAVNNSMRWMSDITREQLDEMNIICGPVLDLLGYHII